MNLLGRQSSKRIAVVADAGGIGPNYHLGDEAMCYVAIDRLSQIVDRTNITLLCSRARSSARTYRVRTVGISELRMSHLLGNLAKRLFTPVPHLISLIHTVRNTDLVFFAGGGNLTDLYPKVLESRLLVLQLAAWLSKPVVLASQTIGPLSEASRLRLQPLLRRAAYIGVRDQTFSASQLGLPVQFAPDDAAFTEPQGDASTVPGADIGISYHLHKVRPQQIEHLLQATAWLIKTMGMQAIFIPHLAKADIPVGCQLQRHLPTTLRILQDPPMPGQIMRTYQGLRLVLSTRYHGVVFALASGVPVVGIYSDDYTRAKIEGAYAQFNLPSYAIHKDHADLLPEQAHAAMGDAAFFKDAAATTRSRLLQKNLEPYRVAARILNGGPQE